MHLLPLGADTRQLAIELLRPVGALGHPLLGIFEQLDAFLPLGADTRQLAIEPLCPVGALGHPLIEPLRPILLVGVLLLQLGDGPLGALLNRIELVQFNPRRCQPFVPLVDLPLQ